MSCINKVRGWSTDDNVGGGVKEKVIFVAKGAKGATIHCLRYYNIHGLWHKK